MFALTAQQDRFGTRNGRGAKERNVRLEMAYVNSRSATVSISDRFGAIVKLVKEAIEHRHIYSTTVNELSNLSDRDLADMGISRLAITDVAREAAYSK